MPELSISEDQREYLESLRAELAEDVGPYGHVRPRDALQFLIDSHGEIEDTSVDAVTEEAGGGTAGDETSDGSDETDHESENNDGSDDSESSEGGADESADESDDDADRLSSMMSLLDEHDGKWRRVKDDGTYEVDLPEGDTETVRTKDEVRAVLFKQY